MPKFKFEKLIRDKLLIEYEKNNQKAEIASLSMEEHTKALANKLIEEAYEVKREIDKNVINDKIIEEIADVQQVIDDLVYLCGLTKDQIEEARLSKFDKKGGFKNGTYVKSLQLSDDDKWVGYYRKNSDVYPEEI